MIRYRLDDLGWYQFEGLMQALLKAKLGLAIESWSGPSDHGRDAYCTESLPLVSDKSLEGPFLFQVKFVENANAAGAKPARALLRAVSKEVARLRVREHAGKQGLLPRYVLLTNAPLSSTLRQKIRSTLQKEIRARSLHLFGGQDVCDLLDQYQTIRRAYPQLLSLRDLDELLEGIINKDIILRSQSAIAIARTLLPVFVPTNAYQKAWHSLQVNSFVVLDGPPEMGKTAIAWMVALVQVAAGWEALICDSPSDLFRAFTPERSQIFIADDAFGRTEYDPSRGRLWEQNLERVLHRVGPRHWLIWTSRKHLLERALKTLDLQGKASGFPGLGEVIVDATQLETAEKALILYRHAKAAGLSKAMREIVKATASLVVRNPNFTPERIRRLLEEVRRYTIARENPSEPSESEFAALIKTCLEEPTGRMRKTFRALDQQYKLLLLAVLDTEPSHLDALERSFLQLLNVNHLPACGVAEVLDDLLESFVRQVPASGRFFFPRRTQAKAYEFLHPSYRDVVIEELQHDHVLRESLLTCASPASIRLAISDTGGASGERTLPLVQDTASWELLRRRCREVVREESVSVVESLLRTIMSSLSLNIEITQQSRLRCLLEDVYTEAREKWSEAEETVPSEVLEVFCKASMLLSPLPPLLCFSHSWNVALSEVAEAVQNAHSGMPLDETAVGEWLNLVSVLQRYEPRFLEQRSFPDSQAQLLELVLDALEAEGQVSWGYESSDDLDSFADQMEKLSGYAEDISSMASATEARARAVASSLYSVAEEMRAKAGEERLEDAYYGQRAISSKLKVQSAPHSNYMDIFVDL